jgi:WD40 repeat protein
MFVCGEDDNFLESTTVLTGNSIHGLSFSSDCKLVAWGFAEYSIDIYSLDSGAVVNSIEFSSKLTQTAFSSDNKCLAVSAHDNTIRVFSLDTKLELYRFLLPSQVYSLQFQYNDTKLVSWSNDKRLRIWSLQDGKMLEDILLEDVFIEAVALTNNDHQVVAVNRKGLVQFFNLDDSELKYRFQLDYPAVKVKYNGQDHTLASVSEKGAITILKPRYSQNPSITRKYDIRSYPLADIGEDVKYAVIAGSRTSVLNEKLVEVKSWNNDRGLVSIIISRAGKQVISADNTGFISVWDVEYGKVVCKIRTEKQVNKLQLSPDENFILAQGEDGWVGIYTLKVRE